MKTIKSVFLFVSLSFFAQAQTIRRVNATPGITGVNIYTTAQAAHNASVAGDIIYIEPTNADDTNYGSLTINRRVTLISSGYIPTLVTGSSFDKRTAFFQNIDMNHGSAGSRITGLSISVITLTDANCIIERNTISNIILGKQTIEGVTTVANNTMIRNNAIRNIFGLNILNGISTINNIISNNIIIGVISYLVSATITRNTFYSQSPNPLYDID